MHGLVGQNGSGKSTLIKVLAGYHTPDPGSRAWLDDEMFELGTLPVEHGLDIRFVHQELALVLQLNAIDNVALGGGYLKRRGGIIHWKQQADLTRRALDRFGMAIDIDVPLARLAPVERTAVAIVRALAGWEEKSGVLVLDEPTASLPASEVDRLHSIVREVSQQDAGVIYVSHRLDDIVAVADRISVLRDGDLVGTYRADEVDSGQLATLMVGHQVEQKRSGGFRPDRTSPPVLTASGLAGRWLEHVDLSVWPGEIVGIAGVLRLRPRGASLYPRVGILRARLRPGHDRRRGSPAGIAPGRAAPRRGLRPGGPPARSGRRTVHDAREPHDRTGGSDGDRGHRTS